MGGGEMYGKKGMKVKKYALGGMNGTGETVDTRKPKEEVRKRRFPLTSGVDTELPTKEEYFEVINSKAYDMYLDNFNEPIK